MIDTVCIYSVVFQTETSGKDLSPFEAAEAELRALVEFKRQQVRRRTIFSYSFWFLNISNINFFHCCGTRHFFW